MMFQQGRRLGLGAALLLGSALPALAQQGLCGGVGDGGQWLGGEEALSDIATAPSYLEQMALVLANTEYVGLFSVSTAGDYRIEAAGRGSGDTVIDLRDAAGNIVISDDDSGGNGSSRAETWLEPGTYCVSLRSYDGSPLTGMVRVGNVMHEALTAGIVPTDDPGYDDPYVGGSCDTAAMVDLGGGQPVDALLTAGGAVGTASAGETPYWGFTLAEPQAITITAENENADPLITLFDPYGSYLNENDDWNGLNAQLDMTYPLEAGTYCIAMTALTDSSEPITVTVKAYDPLAAAMESYARGEMAPPLDGSYPVEMLGSLPARLRRDVQVTGDATWFAVDLPQAGLLLVEAVTNGMGDPVLTVFDDMGRQVAYNDDSDMGLDSRVTARLFPGTYLIALRDWNEGTSVATRLLIERYIAVE